MKKIFSTILILSTVLSITSCKYEEDDIWDKSAAERIQILAKDYHNVLTSSAGGWAMEYYPTNNDSYPIANGYLIMHVFNKDNTVTSGMKNVFSSNAYITDKSTWDINVDQGPVLSFSSYNKCVHVFADPYDLPFTTEDTEDENGKGAQGDYEFVVSSAEKDAETVLLKGKKRGTYIRMTRMPEDVDFQTYIDDCQTFTSEMFPKNNEFSYTIHLGTFDNEGNEHRYSTYDFGTGLPTLYSYGQDRIMTGWTNPYMITKRNDKYYLRFRDTISRSSENGTQTFREFEYDEENDNFVSVDYPECTMEGVDLSAFFTEKFEGGKTWSISGVSDMSQEFLAMYVLLAVEFKTILKYDMRSLTLRKTDDKVTIRLIYGSGVRQQSVSFTADSYSIENGKFSIGNVTGDTQDAKTFLEKSQYMQKLVTLLKGANTISAAKTKFDPTSIRLTNDVDPTMWFIVK